MSSSDGQRFGLQASSLLGALYPRYFGYYDQALTVYTHIADQHSVFHTQVIACSVREAIFEQTDLRGADLTGWNIRVLELKGTIMDRRQVEHLVRELGIQVL